VSTKTDISKTHVLFEWKHESPLIACRIAPDGLQAVSSAEDSTLQLWTIPSGEKKLLSGHESWVHALCYSIDGQQLVSGGCDGKLIWWSAKEVVPAVIRKIDAHEGWIRSVSISADNTTLASVGNDKIVRLWNMSTGEKIGELAGHERHIYCALFHPNGTQLMTGDLLGKIHIWNIADRKLERTIEATPLYAENKGQQAEFGGVRAMAFSEERGELLAGGTHKATNPFGAVHEPLVLRLSWLDGVLKKSHACEGITGGLIWRVQWLKDGTAVGVSGGSTGGILLFFNDTQEKEIHRFKLPSLAREMDIHVENDFIATAHYDKHLRISGMFAKAT
jgi:WD40 repeat protein